MKLEVLTPNARLDLEAQADARALQDTELLRRDLNATFNDADRGMPMTARHFHERQAEVTPTRVCTDCQAVIHPTIVRKRPDATLCYECWGKRKDRKSGRP